MSIPRKSQWIIPVLSRRDWNSYWKPVEEFLEAFSCQLVPYSHSTKEKLVIAEVESQNLSTIKKTLGSRQKIFITVPLSSASPKKNMAFVDALTELSRKSPCLVVALDNRVNAALLALQILSVGKSRTAKALALKLKKYKEEMRSLVLKQKLRA